MSDFSQPSSGGGSMTDAQVKVAYENNANTNEFDSTEQTKLAGIETSATADQTGGEIKTAYESEANTNAFNDAAVTKLAGIEAGATVGGAAMSDADIKTAYENNLDTNVFNDSWQTKLAGIETSATADQSGGEIKTAYESEADTNAFNDAAVTKLAGIEASATADQTGGEIKTAYQAEVSAFTDAQFTKLAGIEAGATVGGGMTDAQVKTAYENNADTNEFSDAEQTKLGNYDNFGTNTYNIFAAAQRVLLNQVWAIVDTTGATAITQHKNLNSITDHGVGEYTFTFYYYFSGSTNYSFFASGYANSLALVGTHDPAATRTTNTMRVKIFDVDGVLADCDRLSINFQGN